MKSFMLAMCLICVTLFSLEASGSTPYPKPIEKPSIESLMRIHKIRLIVMRHGEALHNVDHLLNSSKSPGIYLTEQGTEQVKDAAQKLIDLQASHIYVSPVFRTLQTAQLLGIHLNIPYDRIFVEEQLREQSFGVYEGHTFEEYESYFSNEEDVYSKAVPHGESGMNLYERTDNFLRKMIRERFNETIIIVTHFYNCCQINKCITGSYDFLPESAEFKIFDFLDNKSEQEKTESSISQ